MPLGREQKALSVKKSKTTVQFLNSCHENINYEQNSYRCAIFDVWGGLLWSEYCWMTLTRAMNHLFAALQILKKERKKHKLRE